MQVIWASDCGRVNHYKLHMSQVALIINYWGISVKCYIDHQNPIARECSMAAFKPKHVILWKHFKGTSVSISLGMVDKVFNHETWQQKSDENVSGYIYKSECLAVYF